MLNVMAFIDWFVVPGGVFAVSGDVSHGYGTVFMSGSGYTVTLWGTKGTSAICFVYVLCNFFSGDRGGQRFLMLDRFSVKANDGGQGFCRNSAL